ncbi:MAG: N-acetyl-gamma-glutamyl-phosphate reductase [Gemmatimonadota bacterium]
MMHDSSPLPVGVLGATGYTGREMIKLLAHHPRVRIVFGTSESEAGQPLRRIARAAPEIELVRSEDAPLGEVEVVFCCLPHGTSIQWVERVRAAGARAIDLSSDLRVPGESTPEWAKDVVYGLPELHRERIAATELVANPGCYPTAAILSIVPLARRGLIGEGAVVINAASGITGAGRSPRRDLLFAEAAEDFRAYQVGNVHRHLDEMRDQVGRATAGAAPELVFTPHLLPVKRGILETIYVPLKEPLDATDAMAVYEEDYGDEPFVELLTDGTPSLAGVVGTNLVSIAAVPIAGVTQPLLMVLAAEDNLVKGAAGQALQNLNVMLAWPETEGLI